MVTKKMLRIAVILFTSGIFFTILISITAMTNRTLKSECKIQPTTGVLIYYCVLALMCYLTSVLIYLDRVKKIGTMFMTLILVLIIIQVSMPLDIFLTFYVYNVSLKCLDLSSFLILIPFSISSVLISAIAIYVSLKEFLTLLALVKGIDCVKIRNEFSLFKISALIKQQKTIGGKYDKIYANYDLKWINQYIEEEKEDEINKEPLSEYETRLLKKNTFKARRNTEYWGNQETGCKICDQHDELEEEKTSIDDQLIRHPICSHKVHYQCFINQIEWEFKCKTCGLPTRSNLMRELAIINNDKQLF